MTKICFFSGDITRSGGTERVATMIANSLAKNHSLKISFLSLTEQNPDTFFPLDSSITRTALGKKWLSPGPSYLKLLPKLRHFLKEEKIDILIDIDIVLDILSLSSTKGLPVKIISWEHFNHSFEMKTPYRRFILKHFTKRTDAVVTLTKHDMSELQKEFHRTERIQVIYNPMEELDISAKNALPDILSRENALITVGRLIPIKGVDYIIMIAKRLLPKHTNWKWYILGDGEEMGYLKEKIAKYHLEKQVILTGRVSDVTPYLAKSKIYVMTSRIEGLPMSLLEAKAYRLPIVSFDILTGPNEIIEHEKSGYLIPPFNYGEMTKRLHTLMTTPELLEDFSLHSQDNIKKFQMETIQTHWENLFKKILVQKS